MKTKNQNPDFLFVGKKLLNWYAFHGRDLPFRQHHSPYFIWISEIIFQQTRIQQGLEYYNRFVERFPTVEALSNAHLDEVLLYWKGLGYYSRAINLHKTAQIIDHEFGGSFPEKYAQLLALPGIGKYTAAAIASICFLEPLPAVDGNLYRVLSRFFADEFDISNAGAFAYFSNLALRMMPPEQPGAFNQAMMDLGSAVCTPKKTNCSHCPISENCLSYTNGTQMLFPVKTKKTKVSSASLQYYLVYFEEFLVIKKRDQLGIWKNLYELPTLLPENIAFEHQKNQKIKHKLTHLNLNINFDTLQLYTKKDVEKYAEKNKATLIHYNNIHQYSWPKPIDSFLNQIFSVKKEKQSTIDTHKN